MSAITISDMDENKDVSSCTVLRVYQYDLGTHASSQKRLIQTKEDDNLEKDTLKDLRVFLKDKNVFDSPE